MIIFTLTRREIAGLVLYVAYGVAVAASAVAFITNGN